MNKTVYWAVIDSNDSVVTIDTEKFGYVKAVFGSKDDAVRLAMKYREHGFKVTAVGFMQVVV